jgi:NAD(P)-dependent dehydrogenase (short-subunit alcohol dehydrogenase family)
MSELASQVVLITGAKGGLGTHVTRAFLAAGATVVGTSRAIADSDFADPHFTAIPTDLTDAQAARKLADGVVGRFQKIDALVHVMGGFAGGKSIAETDDSTWDKMMSVNLRSGVNILRAVIPHMRRAGRGRIVVIGSRQAVEPAPGLSAYNASKAALVSLVRTAALENKDLDITANVILPSTMNTEANRNADPKADPSKWVKPERVAAVTVFLVSDSGAQINAAAIPVYGQEA